jgi:peptidoglycan hydrolase-like protein with peptidoglycan-binding domain
MRRATFRNAALISGAFFLAAAGNAWAESADRFQDQQPTETAVPALPVAIEAAVPNIAAELDALQRDPTTASLKVDWNALKDYYAAHKYNAIWTTANGYTLLGQAWIVQIPRAVRAGLPMQEQTLFKIAGMTPPVDSESQTRNEALMSAVFVASAVDAIGPLGSAKERGVAVLDKVAAAKDPGDAIGQNGRLTIASGRSTRSCRPMSPIIRRAAGRVCRRSTRSSPARPTKVIPAVRARLQYTGELATTTTFTDNVYDTDLQAAVAAFQISHGLNDDGVIGGRTLEEMNVPVEKRLQMILLNLDRMREQGAKFEPRHLIVNIPAQEVKVVEDGKVQFMTKAIVGKVDRKTPTLDSVIKVAKFNPEWNAPHKIASNDEVRRMRADPSFLESHGFTVYDGNGMEVSPSAIDWHEVGPGNFPYRLVQAPGPENALGSGEARLPEQGRGLPARHQPEAAVRQAGPLLLLGLHADAAADRHGRLPAVGRSGIPAGENRPDRRGREDRAGAAEDPDAGPCGLYDHLDGRGRSAAIPKDMYKYDRYAALPNDLQPAANLVAEVPQPAKPTKTESK